MAGSTLGGIYYNQSEIPFSSFSTGTGSTIVVLWSGQFFLGIDDGSSSQSPEKNRITIRIKRSSGNTSFYLKDYFAPTATVKYYVGTCITNNGFAFRMSDYSSTNQNRIYYEFSVAADANSMFKGTVPQYYDFSPLFA